MIRLLDMRNCRQCGRAAFLHKIDGAFRRVDFHGEELWFPDEDDARADFRDVVALHVLTGTAPMRPRHMGTVSA